MGSFPVLPYPTVPICVSFFIGTRPKRVAPQGAPTSGTHGARNGAPNDERNESASNEDSNDVSTGVERVERDNAALAKNSENIVDRNNLNSDILS